MTKNSKNRISIEDLDDAISQALCLAQNRIDVLRDSEIGSVVGGTPAKPISLTPPTGTAGFVPTGPATGSELS